MFLLIFTVNSTGFGITCKTSLGICLRGHFQREFTKEEMPNLSMTGCEICSFMCLKNGAPSYSSQTSLQCFEVQSCAAVSWSSFVWSQLLSFTHRCNILWAPPLSIHFSHVHMSGQFSNFPTRKLQAIN